MTAADKGYKLDAGGILCLRLPIYAIGLPIDRFLWIRTSLRFRWGRYLLLFLPGKERTAFADLGDEVPHMGY